MNVTQGMIPATHFKSDTPPKRFKPKRRCEGPGPLHYVTMYTTRQNSGEPGKNVDQRLLCSSCVEKEADRRIEEARRRVQQREARRKAQEESYIVKGLYAARKKRGKTQAQLAMAVGVSAQHLSCVERGMAKTSRETLRRMSQVLKVSMGDLL